MSFIFKRSINIENSGSVLPYRNTVIQTFLHFKKLLEPLTRESSKSETSMIQLWLNQLLVLHSELTFTGLFFLSADLHSPTLNTVGEIVLADGSLSVVKIFVYHSLSISKMFKGEKNCEISLSTVSRI